MPQALSLQLRGAKRNVITSPSSARFDLTCVIWAAGVEFDVAARYVRPGLVVLGQRLPNVSFVNHKRGQSSLSKREASTRLGYSPE